MNRTLWLAVTMVVAVGPSGFAQETLPEGPGLEPTLRICGQCHEAQKAASVRLTREGWNDTIENMKALGATGTPEEFAVILGYLSTHFRGELTRALDMNSADAIDLESVLGLLRRESAAVLQYRAKHGPFDSLADLKGLDPAILGKIEAKKERIVFRRPKR